MLPSDEQGVEKKDRQEDVTMSQVASRGPVHSTQEKVHAILAARHQLRREATATLSTQSTNTSTREDARTNGPFIDKDVLHQRGLRRLRDGHAIPMTDTTEMDAERNGDYVSIQSIRSHYLSATGHKGSSVGSPSRPSLRETLYRKPFKNDKAVPGEILADSVEVDHGADSTFKHLNTLDTVSPPRRYPTAVMAKLPNKQHLNQGADKTDDRAVLVYETFDLSLEREDFMRVMPRNKHGESASVTVQPLDISPGRAESSFDRRNFFQLVFRNLEHAEAFCRQDEVMHKAVVASNSEVLELLPAAHLGLAGLTPEEIATMKDEYTLSTNDQRLKYQIVQGAERQNILQSLQRQLYKGFRARNGTLVLLHVDGASPTSDDIRRELAEDEAQTGNTWSATDRIRAVPQHTIYPSNLDAYLAGDDLEEEGYFPIQRNNTLSRWILTFDDETEARRFIRNWHMREWPPSEARSRHATEHIDTLQASLNVTMLW